MPVTGINFRDRLVGLGAVDDNSNVDNHSPAIPDPLPEFDPAAHQASQQKRKRASDGAKVAIERAARRMEKNSRTRTTSTTAAPPANLVDEPTMAALHSSSATLPSSSSNNSDSEGSDYDTDASGGSRPRKQKLGGNLPNFSQPNQTAQSMGLSSFNGPHSHLSKAEISEQMAQAKTEVNDIGNALNHAINALNSNSDADKKSVLENNVNILRRKHELATHKVEQLNQEILARKYQSNDSWRKIQQMALTNSQQSVQNVIAFMQMCLSFIRSLGH